MNFSYYAPPEFQERSVLSQLQNGNRRLDSNINNENPDQYCCFPVSLVSSSLEEQLDPQNSGLERLVVYLYRNVPSDEAYLYIPNRDKQSLFPGLNYEQSDVLQKLTDKGILKNNTNNSILVNNTSPQPLIDDTKWSIYINTSINNSSLNTLRKSSTKLRNLQKSKLNAPTDEPNVIQTTNPNLELTSNNSRENIESNDYTERSSKSPVDYNEPDYDVPPFFRSSMKREKKLPPAIGFNQAPYMISQGPDPKLKLSEIVPDKNNIIHFTPTNQGGKSIPQPYGLILPDNSGNDISVNMIRVPVKLDLIKVPQNHNTIPLDNGSILPVNQIRAPPYYSKVGRSPFNLKGQPNMNRIYPKSPNQNPDTFGVDPKLIKLPPNRPSLGGRPDNFEDDLYMTQVNPNRPNLVEYPDNLEVNPNIIQVPPKQPTLGGRPDNLGVDPYIYQVPPNHSNLGGRPDNPGVDPSIMPVPPNNPNVVGSPDNFEVDPNMIEISPNRPNSADYLENLRVEPYMIKTPPNQPQFLRMSDLFSNWFYNQIATANQRLNIEINIDTLKRNIVKTLARYNMYISEDGYLIDAQGNIISWDYLQLRAILVGEPMEYRTVINSADPIHFQPSNTYWKALLTTFGPSSQTVILDIIPLGKMQLLEKSGVKVPIDRHICKSGDCKVIVPVQVEDQAILAKLQDYMQLQAQQLNMEQVINRRNLNLKLDPRKEPLNTYDKYRPYKGWGENSKIGKHILTKSGRREKDPVSRDMATLPPRTGNNNRVNDVVDWRIIGGAAATSSGAPINVRGRSGYIL